MRRAIKNSGLLALIAALIVSVTGCATSGDYASVPVEEAGSQSGSVYESSGYPPASDVDQGYPRSDSAADYPDSDYSVPQHDKPANAPSAAASNSAVVALLSSAQQQRKSGDYQRASVTLERAIRISPRNPELYYELAQVRYLEGNFHQSKQLCRKAISLAAGDKALVERCRSLLSRLG